MPYNLELAESEQVIANLTFCPSANSEPLRIAVSDQAIYLPRKKMVAKVDPSYFERVPIHEVLEVRIQKLRPFWLLLLAFTMVAGGTVLTAIMLWPFTRGEKGGFSSYPPAITICGLVIPFVVRNRYRIDIKCARRGFRWKPPLQLDRESGRNTQGFFNIFLHSCSEANIRTVDERPAEVADIEDESSSKGKYPIAELPVDSGHGVVCNCYVCGELIRISRWDHWNSFLTECPHCHQIHGGHWKIYWLLLASLFLNGLSLFLTMRPKQALPWALGFAAFWGFLFSTENRWYYSDLLQLSLFIMAAIGPAAVNAVVAIRHEMALSKATLYAS